MRTYQIGSQLIGADSPKLGHALQQARSVKLRPSCLCQSSGVPMYIALLGEHLVLKRMPNSGKDHAPDCDSFEPPQELSGLGQVLGSAIREDPDAGLTTLKLEFSLTKAPGRAAPVPGEAAPAVSRPTPPS